MREEIVLEDFKLTEDYYLDNIKDVKYEKTDETYNFEVEDTHLYFANGFYTKNSGRRPAILLSEKIGHPDSEEFIKSKKENNRLLNSNISVQIPDSFISALENNKSWKLWF